MTWNTLATACLFWAAATTFLRAEMLRHRLDPRPDTPRPTYQGNWPIIIAMDLAALSFVGWGLEIGSEPPLGLGAALCAVAIGVASTTILISMIGHNWREAIRRKEAEACREVIEGLRPPEAYDTLHRPETTRPPG